MKKTISIAFIALFMSVLFFASCSEDSEETTTDANLITAIENSEQKQPIEKNELPATAIVVLDSEYPNEFISVAQLAPAIGYKVILRDTDAAHYENIVRVYFAMDGRRLTDRQHPDRVRDVCFRIVFPITVTMHNGHVVEIISYQQLRRLIEACDGASDRVRDCFEFNFPITLVIGDHRVIVENAAGLRRAFAHCDRSDRPSDRPRG